MLRKCSSADDVIDMSISTRSLSSIADGGGGGGASGRSASSIRRAVGGASSASASRASVGSSRSRIFSIRRGLRQKM